ncbi:hypothetical protein [Pseudomonas phage Astolliot]|nr:hypothetical protein [Pseudomonas phage Astolliot]
MKIRVRRGKSVIVPEQWVGNFTTNKTINDRKSAARVKRIDRRVRLMKESSYHFSTQLED